MHEKSRVSDKKQNSVDNFKYMKEKSAWMKVKYISKKLPLEIFSLMHYYMEIYIPY